MKKTSWQERFRYKFVTESFMGLIMGKPRYIGNETQEVKDIEQFIAKELKRERIEVLNEAVKLSDRIESGRDSTLEEWKAFKHFRNTLRDKYLKENAQETKGKMKNV